MKPEDALTGFYGSLVRDGDARAACRFAAPDFFLRAPLYLGVNVSADDPVEALVESPPPRDRRGPCEALAERVGARCREQWPWSAWFIERVDLTDDGTTAEAVTQDGSAGLLLVGGEWRVAWAFG